MFIHSFSYNTVRYGVESPEGPSGDTMQHEFMTAGWHASGRQAGEDVDADADV